MTSSTDRLAFELRLDGRTYRQIAEQLGLRNANAADTAVLRYCRTYGLPVPGYSVERAESARRGARTRHGVSTRQIDRRFGVEIEVLGLADSTIARIVSDLGYACRVERYNHQTRNHWKVTTDSSVEGFELVSPILKGADGKQAVREIMAALRAAGGRVDRSCGFHVHHEVVDLTGAELSTVVQMFAAKQATMDAMVAPSRRGTGYPCGRLPMSEVSWYVRAFQATSDRRVLPREHSIGGRDEWRYRALNVHSFPSYGTFEFRQHQGTLNGDKAVAWIDFGQALIAAAVANTGFDAEGADLLTTLANAELLSTSTATYLAERIDALA